MQVNYKRAKFNEIIDWVKYHKNSVLWNVKNNIFNLKHYFYILKCTDLMFCVFKQIKNNNIIKCNSKLFELKILIYIRIGNYKV